MEIVFGQIFIQADILTYTWIIVMFSSIFQKNRISPGHELVTKMNDIMLPKDPFYKPPPQTPDGESNSWIVLKQTM